MDIEEIKTYFEQGRYDEVIHSVDLLPEVQKFEGTSYKILILCLRGEIKRALPLFAQLEKFSSAEESNTVHYIVLALKTCIKSYQGREQEVYEAFKAGEKYLDRMNRQEKNQTKEWEGWFHYGLGTLFLSSEMYEKPILEHLRKALDIIDSLPKKGGLEWILRNLTQYCAMTNQVETAEKYRKEIYNRMNDINHVFGQDFSLSMSAGFQWFRGEYEASIEGFAKTLSTFEGNKLYTLVVGVLNAHATIYLMKGEFEKAIEHAEEAIQVMNQHGFYWPYPWNVVMGAYLNKGDTETSLKYTKQRLILMEEFQNHKGIIKQLRWIAQIYYTKAEYEEALKWTEKCLPHTIRSKNLREQVWVLELIGIIYYQMGKLDPAIKYLQQALTLSKDLRKEFGGEGITTGHVQANLAELYSMRGDFDQALELMESSLALMENHESAWYQYNFYLTMGTILMKKGDFLKAKTQLQKSLALNKKYGNIELLADTLYHLVLVNCELDSVDEAQQYFQQLEQLSRTTTDPKVTQQIQIAKGIIYKKSPRAVMKAKAQEIFQHIAREEKIELDLSIFGMLNLLELLIWEVSSSGHEEVLAEIQQLLQRLDNLAQQQKAHTLEIEVRLIQSRLKLIMGNINQAMEVLKQAHDIAHENNLSNYQNRIERQEEEIEAELQKWRELTERNAPLIERIQESQVIDYIDTALRLVGKGSSQEERIKTPSAK